MDGILAVVNGPRRRYVAGMTTDSVPVVSSALRVLMRGAVDYAGLFPPGGLAMSDGVRHYAHYRAGPYSWMLGRFVLPAARLDEFIAAASRYQRASPHEEPWRLSVVVGPDTERDMARVARIDGGGRDAVVVDSVEARVVSPEGVRRLAAVLPRGILAYVELPMSGELEPLMNAVVAARLRAKARTGGVTRDLIPSPGAVAAFLVACARHDVPFKVTAGLHHAVRASYPLTYEADSARATMFGFLNVFVAAMLAQAGEPERIVVGALEETDRESFSFGDTALRWRDRLFPVGVIQRARETFVTSFGSCSFHEPVAELGLGDALPPVAEPRDDHHH